MFRFLDDNVALMGMSCVGKTTFANKLAKDDGRLVISFDASYYYDGCLFPGYSMQKNIDKIIRRCNSKKFVIDNWAFYDLSAKTFYEHFPNGAIYILYSRYKEIIKRYRTPVIGPDGFKMMYKNMYLKKNFSEYNKIRFIKVTEDLFYEETNYNQFKQFIEEEDFSCDYRFDQKSWRWVQF